MESNTALLILVGLVALATSLGVLIRRTQTRVRRIGASAASAASAVPPEALAAEGEAPPAFGERLTAVQFSSETCARCPATARALRAAAGAHRGVAHIEVDVTHRDDLISRFALLRTPTVLLLDADGGPVARVTGPLGLPQAASLLDAHLQAGGASAAAGPGRTETTPHERSRT